jgi:hypothetical protein
METTKEFTKVYLLRRCDCTEFSLVIRKISVRRRKQRYSNPFKNLIADALLGTEYCKPICKWKAECSQCEKLYWVSDTQKSMKEKIQFTGFPVNYWTFH